MSGLTVTNDYHFISVSRLSDRDSIAPNWWRILISGRSMNGSIVRVFSVTAPSIVGRYFFKVFTDGVSIGATNFPTLVVSADINPAYISGTVLDGCRDSSRYGIRFTLKILKEEELLQRVSHLRVEELLLKPSSTRVRRVDILCTVWRLVHISSSPPLQAISTATRPEPVSVVRGQSLDGADIFVCPSPRLEGIVWSKCSGLLEPWGGIAESCSRRWRSAGSGPRIRSMPFVVLVHPIFFNTIQEWINGIFSQHQHPARLDLEERLPMIMSQHIYALGGDSTIFWSYDTRNNQPQGLWQVTEQ